MMNHVSSRAANDSRYSGAIIKFVALLAFGLAALMLWMYSDPERGLPAEQDLVSTSGKLLRASGHKGTIRFYLHGHAQGFQYSSKMGHSRAVERALDRPGAKVGLKYHPDYQSGPIYSDERYFDVFHLSVNGKVIRSYRQIRRSWITDNRLAGWLGIAFILMGWYLVTATGRRPEADASDTSSGA